MATNETLLPQSMLVDAIGVGAALSDPKSFGVPGGPASTPFVLIPNGYKLQSLADLYPTPARKKGSITLNDPESFILAINEQTTSGTRLYGTVKPAPKFVAVFNDHAAGEQAGGWRDHTATYDCPLSAEWQTWMGKNKVTMTQAQFAEFVEDNEPDILPPTSDRIPTMKEVGASLEATKGAAVTQGTKLSNGQVQFTYQEEVSGTVSKGKFDVPEMFCISIPVFDGGEAIQMPVRFRYRVTPGGFTLFYDIVRPHKVLEDATRRIWSAIEKGTGLTIFHGR